MAKKEAKQEFYPAYVIVGKDSFLVNKECEQVLSTLMDEDERDMSMYSVDAGKADIKDVLDELRTLPFLAKKRVVVIRQADKFVTAYRRQLEHYFENPSKRGVLVMTVSTWQKNTILAKLIAKRGKTITVKEVNRRNLADYAAGFAKEEHKKNLSKSAAQLLVEVTGDELSMVCGEVSKLAAYVGNSPQITAEDVAKLCGSNREFDLFSAIDEMTRGNTAAAVGKLRNMFAADKDAEYTVVGGLAFHFRRMFKAKVMLTEGTPANIIANQLRIFGDRNAFFNQLKRWQLATIASIIEALARIDYQAKTGQARTAVEVEQLIMKVSMKLSKPPGR